MRLGQKHLSVLEEARRRGQTNTNGLRHCFELLTVATAIDRDCAARLSPHQLSEGKFVLLFLLYERSGGLSPHELADKAGVTRATITGLLDGLERDGIVTRHHDTDDRRKITVLLTEKGDRAADVVFRQHSEWISSLFAGFSAEESRLLSEMLGRIWRRTEAGENEPVVPIGAPL